MIISISTDIVVARALAFSAIRHFEDPAAQRPSLLTEDARPALALLARGGFSMVCCDLLPELVDCNIDQLTAENCEVMTVELRQECQADPTSVYNAAEEVIYLHIMAEVYAESNPSLSEVFNLRCEAARRRLRNTLLPTTPIRPHRF